MYTPSKQPQLTVTKHQYYNFLLMLLLRTTCVILYLYIVEWEIICNVDVMLLLVGVNL